MTVNKIVKFVILTVICAFSSTAALGQTGSSAPKQIETINNGGSISWMIGVPYETATLTISMPDGSVYRREFPAGTVPTFSVWSRRSGAFRSGIFNYELVLTPVLAPGVKEALAQARDKGNGAAIEADLKIKGMLPERIVESGAFTVINGQIVRGGENDVEPQSTMENSPAQTENSSTARSPKIRASTEAQYIQEDLSVKGSICVGFDCANGEVFGFDTLRLKENNLRINFDDTSNSASFPNNDWQITINDSTNGGANKFSIDDITGSKTPFTIEAGARNNALYVDDAGRIGLGTSTPMVRMHAVEGNTPTLRLEQDGSSGFAPQTWDIAGNEANFFIRDLTSGSNRLPFRIEPGAPTNSIYTKNTGDIGLGTSTPSGPLDITRNGKKLLVVDSSGNLGLGTETPAARIDVKTDGSTSEQLLLLDNAGKLTTKSWIEIKEGGITFPDGSKQTTAATGSGGSGSGGGASQLGAQYSQYIFGGQGTIAQLSNITPKIDYNRFMIGTGGANGYLSSSYTIPSNSNLADQTATHVVYKIRYRDQDGTGTDSQVRVDLVAVATDGGGRVNTLLFDSNTNPATNFNTVTICMPVDGSNFNFASRGMHLNVTLFGTSSANADFGQIQIYKTLTCP